MIARSTLAAAPDSATDHRLYFAAVGEIARRLPAVAMQGSLTVILAHGDISGLKGSSGGHQDRRLVGQAAAGDVPPKASLPRVTAAAHHAVFFAVVGGGVNSLKHARPVLLQAASNAENREETVRAS